jgi:hypothetical protein
VASTLAKVALPDLCFEELLKRVALQWLIGEYDVRRDFETG